jgi:hypothetical protein
MAMKAKVMAFVLDSNMFVGSNYDENGKMGMVTFQDDSPYTATAQRLTEQALKDDKGIELLEKICKVDLGSPKHRFYDRAHAAKTEIWTILWHKFLIEALEANGWTILNANFVDFNYDDLAKYHMEI